MKNKKLLKAICLMLSVSTAVCLSACGDEKSGKNENEDKSVLWYYPAASQPDQQKVNAAASEYTKEKLGVKLELSPIDSGSYQERMNMIIASNENYDICFTSNWTNKFQPNVYKNAYQPLTELLKETPALTKSIPDFAWTASKINGDIYAVPNYQIMFYDPALVFNEDIYNKYESYLQNIKEVEDLEPFLAQIKANEPDKFPFLPTSAAFFLRYSEITGSMTYADDNSKVFVSYTQDRYKEYINLMSDWFKKGYIRQDIAGVTDNGSDISADKYAVWTAQYKPGGKVKNIDGTDKKVKYIHLLDKPIVGMGAGNSALTAISSNSSSPLDALKVIELANKDKDFYNLLCNGIEGEHFTKVSDELIEIKADSKYKPGMDWIFGNQFNAYYTNKNDIGIWEETEKMNRDATKTPLYGFVFDSKNVTSEIVNVTSVVSEYSYLEKGVANIGSDYDDFVAKLSKSGMDKIVTEVEKQLEEFEGKK